MTCGCTRKPDPSLIPADTLERTGRHPCFSFEAHHKYARMHLPVAPKCNISCNYCSRKFDCVNESRPGVTSEVLTPHLALQKFNLVKEKIANLSVVGIAGPGDALANWENTKKSIELIKQSNPEIIFCLSTNGLMLPEYAREIVKLGIKHVTVTVNTLKAEIGARIYKYVSYRGQKFEGTAGAGILIKNQLSGIKYLTQNGVIVKVNIVMIKAINDFHIPDVVKKAKELGVFITNIMPLIPAPGSTFANYPQTSMKELNKMRNLCQVDLQQMYHCKQCRADAIGLLGDDRSFEFRMEPEKKKEVSTINKTNTKKQYKIAVASKHGQLVDQHFGQTSEFAIYQGNGEVFQLVEKRNVKSYCTGADVCNALKDCDAVLSLRIGHQPKEKLFKKGILSIETCDTVENGLHDAVKQLNKQKAV